MRIKRKENGAEEAAMTALLVDEIHVRGQEKDGETEDDAQSTLSIVDEIEHTKIASYIAHQKTLIF